MSKSVEPYGIGRRDEPAMLRSREDRYFRETSSGVAAHCTCRGTSESRFAGVDSGSRDPERGKSDPGIVMDIRLCLRPWKASEVEEAVR